MNPADDRILEYLAEHGAASPKQVADDDRIGYSRTHVNTRLRQLSAAKLARHIGNGVYQLTEEGEAYLEGEFDARDLPDPDD